MDLEVFKAVVIYSLFGMGVFLLAFLAMVKLAPFSLRKEIEEDQNTALGIVLGSVILGLAHIIASVVHG
jgi:putative membrane protein